MNDIENYFNNNTDNITLAIYNHNNAFNIKNNTSFSNIECINIFKVYSLSKDR